MDSAERKQYLTVGEEMGPDFRSPLVDQNSQIVHNVVYSDTSKARKRSTKRKRSLRQQRQQIANVYELIIEELYPSAHITCIFILIIFINLMINIDHGSIPAATFSLKEDLNLDNFWLGILGSVVYLGLTVGSLVAAIVFSYVPQKLILITCLTVNGLALLMFTSVKTFGLLCLSRFIVGFCQIFFCIYFPVWVDTFAQPSKKTLWLSCLLLAVPMGIVIGYVLTGILVQQYSWRISFYFQAMLVIPSLLLITITPRKYFRVEEALDVQKIEKQKVVRASQGQTGGTDDQDSSFLQNRRDIPQKKDSPLEKSYSVQEGPDQVGQSADLFAEEVFLRRSEKKDSINFPLYQFHTVKYSKNDKGVENIEQHVKVEPTEILRNVFSNKAYLFLTLSLSLLYFLMNGVSFWLTDYLIVVLKEPSTDVYVYFSVTCVTAPLLGVLSGGVVIHRQGGYTSDNAMKICITVGMVACVFALSVPYIDFFPVLQVVLWFLMFLGSFILPILTGILITIVNPCERTIASSISNLCYNLFGYLPSPFLYGLVTNLSGGDDSRWGMIMLMFSSIISVMFLVLSFYIKQDQMQQQKIQMSPKKTKTIPYSLQGYENLLIYESLKQEQLNSLKKLESMKGLEMLALYSVDLKEKIGEVENENSSYASEKDSYDQQNFINRDVQIQNQDYDDSYDFEDESKKQYFMPGLQDAIIRCELARKSSFFEPIARVHTIW